MSIDKNTVTKIARLARIKVTEDEKEVLSRELGSILKMIEELDRVNTDGVEPMTSVVQMQLFEREDVITDGEIQEKILSNAPEATAGFFVVPKVVE
ncbi:MAG TPA: Asp-tRNA(Asn)/Glu-tRNA(Gln) amidotransferase subunit GatC [Patescibacteria group bacterium]|nr:Asp-tRNA(Asn)/Glu-tRNA(Gln) amidotransferase subunit GatC [Patescibacteria group bacterium]